MSLDIDIIKSLICTPDNRKEWFVIDNIIVGSTKIHVTYRDPFYEKKDILISDYDAIIKSNKREETLNKLGICGSIS